MHLGISSFSLPWAVGVAGFLPPQPLTALQLLEQALASGVAHVQFGDNLPLHQLQEDELQALSNSAKQNHLTLEVGTRGLTQENLATYLRLAQRLESPFLRMVIDDGPYKPSMRLVVDTIRNALTDFKKCGVQLALENHDRFPVRTLAQIIQETSPEWVGICLDTANSLGAGEGVETVVQVLAPYTLNLHVKDILIERVPNKMGFSVTGCAAGQGVIPIPEILALLRSYRRCYSVTLELWPAAEQDIALTLTRELELFETSIRYLKSILP